MRIVRTVKEYLNISIGDELRVHDFEDKKWMNAKISDIDALNGKARIKCDDGLEYWESESELVDKTAYRFINEKDWKRT